MNTRAAVLTALITSALGIATLAPSAEALPLCGGNNHTWQAPVTCTNTRTIDGTTFTVVLDETAAGHLTVSYTLDAPRTVDTPIVVRSHTGKSGAVSGVNPTVASGVITAGATTGQLSLQAQCGQVDMKAVFVGPGQPQGRVGGPMQSNTSCLQSPPPPPPPVTTPPPPGVTTPPPVATPPTGTTTPPSQPQLPATGGGMSLAGWAVLILAVGAFLSWMIHLTHERRDEDLGI